MQKPWYLSRAVLAGTALIGIGILQAVTGDASLIDALVRALEGAGLVGIRLALKED